jgi:capsular exopolysaccharide synthesis family protein
MEEREIHLRDYLQVVHKRRYFVYTVFIIVFSLVFIGTISSTPVYMASTKVLIEKEHPYNMPMISYYPVLYDPEFYDTQYQLIKSLPVGKKVVKMLSLDRRYESFFQEDERKISIFKGTLFWFKKLFARIFGETDDQDSSTDRFPGEEAALERDSSRADSLARMISGGISVSPIKDSRVVMMSYMSTNPELATMIVNSVAKAYIDQLLEMRLSSSQYTLEWMTRKAEEERDKIENSEKALQEYMRVNNILTLENRVAIIPEKLNQLSVQLTQAQSKKRELEEVYKRVKKISGKLEDAETIPAIAADPTLKSLREQILKADQNRIELSKKYGKKHPAMVRAISDLQVLKQKRELEIGRIIESIRNEYELAKSNEDNLKKFLSETKNEAINVNEKFIQYGILKREAETNRQLYDVLLKKMKEQSMAEQIAMVKVWIVEESQTPRYPIKPNKKMNLLIGLIAGLFGGVGLAFFVEYLDQSIKSAEDTEKRLGVPVLGMVSLQKDKEKGIENVVINEPRSSFSEEYRSIRTSVLLSSAEAPPKRILVTSMGPSEGKTVTASNLALTVAQSEYRVVLVDGDLRRPCIHRLFNVNNSKGLSTYLAGASNIDIIQRGPLPKMDIIPSGPIPPNPSELLGSKLMDQLITMLNVKYNIIIVDSPPLLSVVDGLILSRVIDNTIVITRGGDTTYDIARKGIKSLRDINSHILGIVINAVDVKKSGYYYRYYHRYYKQYYGDSEENPEQGS